MTTVELRPPLARPRAVLLSGVSVAVARHLGWSPALVRLQFALLTLLGGAGVLLYLWLWALTPLANAADPADDADPSAGAVRRRLPVGAILFAVTAGAGLLAVLLSWLGWTRTPLVPGLLESAAAGVASVAWGLVMDRRDPRRDAATTALLRVLVAVVLISEGGLLLLARPDALAAVLAVGLIVVGALILVIPRLVSQWTELLGERSARAREEQRAEIAAHLHDSVLQTLALIQARAGAQSEVARLARAQERELRDWLFAGTDPFAGDLATELRTIAASLELAHAVRIEVVTAGDTTGITSSALVGAAREAMLNASRHAGGEVSVYVETMPDAVDVFIRDRGAGFDPEAVAASRLGIRESIVGRMARAGGTAQVTSDSAGTEVQLHLGRAAAQGAGRGSAT